MGEILTAVIKQGRLAIEEVMRHSYVADIDSVPPQWARVLVTDGVPVSFVLVDPDRQMEFHGGEIPYAFICGVATREDRRREGHFRSILEHTFQSLCAAGVPLVLTHGTYQLYRRFGFDVFTHHCGIFATPELIERKLGTQVSDGARHLLLVEKSKHVKKDLLVITDVKSRTFLECKAALQAAAGLARMWGKTRILFEHPTALSYGSRYPTYQSLEAPFTILARACGAQICIQAADPEGGSVPDADWIKVLDASAFLRKVLMQPREPNGTLREASICFDTDAGLAAIKSLREGVVVSSMIEPDAAHVKWPSSALAQLVMGYTSPEVLATIHATPLSTEAIALLETLFPKQWRLSRNESWTFGM